MTRHTYCASCRALIQIFHSELRNSITKRGKNKEEEGKRKGKVWSKKRKKPRQTEEDMKRFCLFIASSLCRSSIYDYNSLVLFENRGLSMIWTEKDKE